MQMAHLGLLAYYGAAMGRGLLLLMVSCFGLLLCLGWIARWAPRRFRAVHRPPLAVTLALAGAALVVMVLYPPQRKAGSWHEVETGQPASFAVQMQCDRFWFGYIPTYAWIGRCFAPPQPEPTGNIRLAGQDSYFRSDQTRWAIEWWALFWQVLAVLLVLLPYVRRKPVAQGRSRPGAGDAPGAYGEQGAIGR